VCFEIVFALGISEFSLILVLMIVNLIDGLLVEPGSTLTHLPEAVLDLVFSWVFVDAKTVLLSFVPPAFVLSPVGPVVKAVSCFLVLLVLSLVCNAVSINVNAHAVHVIVLPAAIILSTIFPLVLASAIDLVVFPVTLVDAAICPEVNAEPLLLTVVVLALVL
jgi:hypothetical protein